MAERLQVGKRVDALWKFVSVTDLDEGVVVRAAGGVLDVGCQGK